MAESLTTIKAKVALVIQDVSGVIATGAGLEMESSIAEALARYSNDVPREIVSDIAGDGSAYDLTLPGDYIDGWSRVVTVEYPAGERTPRYVDGNEWSIYRTEDAVALRLHTDTPGTGTTVRVVLTTPHTLDGLDSADTTTIPTRHTWPFVNLCASRCLLKLAPRFTHEQESTLNADSVDRNNKGDLFRRLAGTLERDYEEQVGVTNGEAPAMAVRDWDTALYRGYGALTHRRRDV